MQNIGPIGLIVIAVVALILFGPKKLPELGRAFGRTLREFKEGTKELMKEDDKGEQDSRQSITASTEKETEIVTKKDDKRLPD